MGRHNPRLVEIRRALRRGELTADGLLPVEGPILIGEARDSGLEIPELFLREGQPPPVPAGRTHVLESSTFRSITTTREPRGVLALVRPRLYDLEALLSPASGVWIVLCGLQDPGNVGTILRLADAFGAAGCIRAPGTVSFYNDKLVRASAGSIFRVPWTSVEDLGSACGSLRSRGISILGTASDAAATSRAATWAGAVALVFGREGRGLTPSERQLCDTMLKVSHRSEVDSLNVASVAAILLAEAYRYRKAPGPV
jgi:TrmH family RNA methyltransferase